MNDKIRNKTLLDKIESEKQGVDFVCPEADKPLFKELLFELNDCAGTKFNYVAEIVTFHFFGWGEIVKRYIKRFASESIKGYLLPKLLNDKVKDCEYIILELYQHFRKTNEYISPPSVPAPAHIYVSYDNAFKQMKPKHLSSELMDLMKNPRDVFYLPLTMKMLASWKLPDMKKQLLLYLKGEDITEEVLGINSQEPFYPPFEHIKKEIIISSLQGSVYYPTDDIISEVDKYLKSLDEDIRAVAVEVLKKL